MTENKLGQGRMMMLRKFLSRHELVVPTTSPTSDNGYMSRGGPAFGAPYCAVLALGQ